MILLSGQASDMRIQADEILRAKATLNQVLSDCTGRPIEQIEKDTERDRYMDTKEALEYGIIDEILDSGKDDDKKDSSKKKK